MTQEIDNLLITELKKSLDNMYPANDPKAFPNVGGHYVILSTIDVPGKPTIKFNDMYVWYNGTSGKLRSRLKSHLHRTNVYGASSAIAVETMTNEDCAANTRAKDSNYFKKADENNRYINGINIADYPNAEFFVATIETETYDGPLEKLFRQEFGAPSLCQYKKR